MFNKIKILSEIIDGKIIAVIRAGNLNEAIKISDACIKGGIKLLEITFTTPKAEEVIEQIKEKYMDKVIVGAGTVLDSETARIAILKGAEFIVEPNFNLDVSKLCNRYQVPYMAGCMTINEMINAIEYGTDVIKLFPGSNFKPSVIKDIKGPLPQINIMPTGGVDLKNIKEWIDNGCIAVGIGAALTGSAKEKNYELITQKAKEFIERIK